MKLEGVSVELHVTKERKCLNTAFVLFVIQSGVVALEWLASRYKLLKHMVKAGVLPQGKTTHACRRHNGNDIDSYTH